MSKHLCIVRSPEPDARSAATSCLRKARLRLRLSQDDAGRRLGTTDRVVRRRESGSVDLGALEDALRDPTFAEALALEILAAVRPRKEAA